MESIQCSTAAQFVDGCCKVELKVTKVLCVIGALRSHLRHFEQLFHAPAITFRVLEDPVEARNILGTNEVEKCKTSLVVYEKSRFGLNGIKPL